MSNNELQEKIACLEKELKDLRSLMADKMVEYLYQDYLENPDNPDPTKPWVLEFNTDDINFILAEKEIE